MVLNLDELKTSYHSKYSRYPKHPEQGYKYIILSNKNTVIILRKFNVVKSNFPISPDNVLYSFFFFQSRVQSEIAFSVMSL